MQWSQSARESSKNLLVIMAEVSAKPNREWSVKTVWNLKKILKYLTKFTLNYIVTRFEILHLQTFYTLNTTFTYNLAPIYPIMGLWTILWYWAKSVLQCHIKDVQSLVFLRDGIKMRKYSDICLILYTWVFP